MTATLRTLAQALDTLHAALVADHAATFISASRQYQAMKAAGTVFPEELAAALDALFGRSAEVPA